MTDRYMKVVFTSIALALIWLGVKVTRLEPVVSAQNQGWDAPLQEWDDDPLALGLPNTNLALPESSGSAYVCYSRLYPGTAYAPYEDWRLWVPFPEFQDRTQLRGRLSRLRSNVL
jgi:hypothetical protein